MDLNDTPEIVLTAYVVGRYLSIYKTNTIYETVFVGPPVFFDFRRIDTPGISLRRSLVNILVLGLFGFGRDDAYIFDQNQSRPIGKPVRQEILGTINWNAADTANAWFRPDVGRVYLNIPTGNSTWPNKVWAWTCSASPAGANWPATAWLMKPARPMRSMPRRPTALPI